MRVLALAVLFAGCGNKKATVDTSIVGWHRASDSDKWSCWYPSNYEEMGFGDRKLSRAKNLDAMISQWNGSRNDGVSFEARLVEDLETVLLGKPEAIEELSRKNLEICLASSKDGSTISWGQWLTREPARLTEGECPSPPLDYTLYDYLDIGRDWHIPASVCEGDFVNIRASAKDFYQIVDDGPFINTEGDPALELTDDVPCTLEGCVMGQLVMRFRAESGVETVIPIGIEKQWRAPEHGEISVMINDTEFYDNRFKVEQGIEHHTSIEYSPIED